MLATRPCWRTSRVSSQCTLHTALEPSRAALRTGGAAQPRRRAWPVPAARRLWNYRGGRAGGAASGDAELGHRLGPVAHDVLDLFGGPAVVERTLEVGDHEV